MHPWLGYCCVRLCHRLCLEWLYFCRSENVMAHKGALPGLRIVGCLICLIMTGYKICLWNLTLSKALGVVKSVFISVLCSLVIREHLQWCICKVPSILILQQSSALKPSVCKMCSGFLSPEIRTKGKDFSGKENRNDWKIFCTFLSNIAMSSGWC